MTSNFEKWYSSKEYDEAVKGCQLGISLTSHLPDGNVEAEIINCKEYAEICFHAGEQTSNRKEIKPSTEVQI